MKEVAVARAYVARKVLAIFFLAFATFCLFVQMINIFH